MKTNEQISTKQFEDVDLLEDHEFPFNLIVWNDEINTFDWVIDTLMDVCGHDHLQAEQCTLIIHHKGKCAVKNGDFATLKNMCNEITERGIGATIEELIS